MKNSLFILLIFLGFHSLAQEKSLMYKISKEGHQTSFVYGTMHILPDSLYYFPKLAQKQLKGCDELVMEIDMTQDNQMAIMKKMSWTKTESSFSIYSAAQKDSLVNWVNLNFSLPPKTFESSFSKLHPFALMQLTVMPLLAQPHKKVEEELTKIAKDKKMPISGLETADLQLDIFLNMSDSALVSMIMGMVRSGAEEDVMKKMYAAYKAQDIELLEQMITQSEGLSKEVLLDKRNKNWIPQIEEKTKTKSIFVGVGAGHLGGELGVLQLLKNAGWTVEAFIY